MTRNQNKLNNAPDITISAKGFGIKDIGANNMQKDRSLSLNGKEQQERKEQVIREKNFFNGFLDFWKNDDSESK